jgi:hypothetical protein
MLRLGEILRNCCEDDGIGDRKAPKMSRAELNEIMFWEGSKRERQREVY